MTGISHSEPGCPLKGCPLQLVYYVVTVLQSIVETVEKSQWRVDKSALLLIESITIETLQCQRTGRTLRTKRVKDMFCLSGFVQFVTCFQKRFY